MMELIPLIQTIGITTAGAVVTTGVDRKITEWFERRGEEARNILLEELGQGNINPEAVREDAQFEIIFRYNKALRDGASKKNLAIMAKIIRGTFEAGDDIAGDRCKYLMDIVAELSESEMELLISLYKVSLEEVRYLYSDMIHDYVPNKYNNRDALLAAEGRLLRTGLILFEVRVSGVSYKTSPLMDELMTLVKKEEWLNTF